MWGLRADEVEGAPFLDLDIGLPVDELADVVDQCLAELVRGERLVRAVNRRGRNVVCRVTCSPINMEGGEGALIVMQEVMNEVSTEAQ